MTNEIGLAFLPNPGGDAEGLSDAGVETFRDKPFAAVARETGQNSRDARAKASEPVRMTFDMVTIATDDFPDIESYRESVDLCLAKARRMKKEKDIGFFEQAKRALDSPEIRILRICDFNTKGVRGPCVEGQPFHTLAKADGVTDKDEIDSGGSFGIGKNAVFALSDIQTAFFSTLYEDSTGDEHRLCIGKTLFVSHTGKDGEEKRRKGYWGKLDGFLPIDKPEEIPEWLRRDTKGTSIFSVCMRNNPTDWRYEMAAALLMNFFTAVERREMEFEIDGGAIKINKNTIQALFQDPKVIEAVEKISSGTAFNTARTLHAVLVDEATSLHILNVPELGDVHMHMLMRDGMGYTVGIVRNGMYITDNLANFKGAFKRFPLHQDFAVIIEPAGKQEGEWFKRLEGPKHDNLSAERITDPEMRAKGQRAFEDLTAQVKATIKELAKSSPSSTLELDELNDLFASEQTRIEDDKGLEEDPRSFQPTPIKPVPTAPRPPVKRPRGKVLRPGPEPKPPQPTPPNPNPPPPGPGPKPRPVTLDEPIELERERTARPDKTNKRKRRLMFTSPKDGNICVMVDATGLSSPEALSITSASKGKVERGSLILACGKNERVSVDVEFETEYLGPVELSALLLGDNAEEAA